MDEQRLIARVVVDVPSRALTEPFDYLVPSALTGQVTVGVPVAVPLGPRMLVGYVVGLSQESSFAGTLRPIDAVLGSPVFGEEALETASWIAVEYVAPLSEALRLFLPPGGAPSITRDDGGWRLVRAQATTARELLVALAEGASPRPRANAHVQRAVLEALAAGPITVGELAAEYPGARGAIAALERAGAVTVRTRVRYRRPGTGWGSAPRHEHTAEQAAAVSAIGETVASGGGTLLIHGITGSGKTEVYLSAIESVLAGGGSAIVLVPEISLTPQMVGRFRSRLGDDVAVIHSRLSAGERFDQWRLALEGQVRVVVGARSALFVPLRDVRLVVIDEEHEPSYKQSQTPRYHARDVALRMAATRGVTVILGSATPSMESLCAAEDGRIRSVRLTRRVGEARPPSIAVVDMTAEFAAGRRSMFSLALQGALRGVVERREKAVLFLNRRGFAAFLLCRECGFVPECDSCSVSLTYHEDATRLMCHHCGASAVVPALCPRCSSPYLRRFGAGTQRAEAELVSIFPGLDVVRMDADTTSGKGGHERALQAFEALESGALLGTQMIAKGLDYPQVTLVGVLNADTSMHLPDFRAAERTYQLLEQVAGRAGRGERPGNVIVQTYWPDHPAIRALVERDPEILYGPERDERRALGYPPFTRLVNVLYSGPVAEYVSRVASAEAEIVRAALGSTAEVLGPAPAPLTRVKRAWRWHFIVKAPPALDAGGLIGGALGGPVKTEGVTRVIDVDPVSLL